MRRLLLALLLACAPAEAATRFYLGAIASETPPISPAVDAGWEDTNDLDRRDLMFRPSGTIGTNLTAAWTAGQDSVRGQFISPPLDGGVDLTGATVKCYARGREWAVDDDTIAVTGLRVLSQDGTTVRVTLIAVDSVGADTEFDNSATLENRTWLNGDTVAGAYTLVDGDRIVLELGFTDIGGTGTTPQGTIRAGSPSASDLPEDETTTTDDNPWFEISVNVTPYIPTTGTRFYFGVAGDGAPAISPSADAAWEDVADLARRNLMFSRTGGAMVDSATVAWTTGQDANVFQFISPQLDGGVNLTGATVRAYARTSEGAASDNVFTVSGLRVLSADGTVVNQTLITVASNGSGTEPGTAMANRSWLNGDTVAGAYTTVDGDRLVLEVGWNDTAGTTPQAIFRNGSETAYLLDDDETTTWDGTPWFDISVVLTEYTPPTGPGGDNGMLLMGVGE